MIHSSFSRVLCITSLVLISTAALAADYPLRDAVESHARGGLPNVFAKLQTAGSEVKIGYLGGSITAQAGWRVKSLKWFQEQYPSAKVSEINAAIGGTGSDLGVFRVQQDVLRHQPDLLFVEFAVNDGGADPVQIHKCMEGIVRQTWRANPLTDICFVYTLSQPFLKDLQADKYQRSASAMEELADHYGIPTIHMGLEAARMEKAGKLIFKGELPKGADKMASPIVFSPDGVHPFPETGHELYLQAIVRSMKSVKPAGKKGAHKLIKPLRDDNWEQAKMIPLTSKLLQGDWQDATQTKNPRAVSFQRQMPQMWTTGTPGASIAFKFKGIVAGVYDLLGPDCGQVSVKVDDKPARTVARIDGYCTYHRLSMNLFARDLPTGTHSASLTLMKEVPDKAKILFEKNRPDMEKNPEKYEGASWYVGAVMLIGDLVE